jgi:hypothetical protein
MALFGLAILLGSVGCAAMPRPPKGTDLGPLVSRLDTVDGVDQTRVLGSIGEYSVGPSGETLSAVRPFAARVNDPNEDLTLQDIFWPVGTTRQRAERRGWRMLLAYRLNDDVNDPDSRAYFWLFPFIYHGRSQDGKLSTGVFPFYGVSRDALAVDSARFVLFPLYAQVKDGETKTTIILWPFYRRGVGPRDDQLRLWPFYGRHTRKGRWEKRFIAWPFWTQVRYMGEGQEGSGFVLFPLYGKSDVGSSKLRMILPPLFQFVTWEDGYRTCAPWPFFEWSRNGEDYKHQLWPLVSDKKVGHTHRSYMLWPIFWRTVLDRHGVVDTHYRIVPFVYYAKQELKADAHENQQNGRDFMLWPLVDYRRRGERSSTRMLCLWPLRRTRAVERSWAPLWMLYSRQRAGAHKQTELLWGLYRHNRSPQKRRMSIFPLVSYSRDSEHDEVGWQLLCGLLGRKRIGDDTAWRILFMGGRPNHCDREEAVPVASQEETNQ